MRTFESLLCRGSNIHVKVIGGTRTNNDGSVEIILLVCSHDPSPISLRVIHIFAVDSNSLLTVKKFATRIIIIFSC